MEKARRTSIRRRCEETESVTVNAPVLREYINFDNVKGFGFDGAQPGNFRSAINVILLGNPAECPFMEEGCWAPVK